MTAAGPGERPAAQVLELRVASRDESQLRAFVQLCKTIQQLGGEGSSRTIPVHVDGDGAADLRFDFGDTDVDAVGPLDSDDDELDPIGIGT